eukprot:TRINITY_DN24381_c0_g1_i1.p1 TRINITY_DN24381_c0_g1~~TRINITY_DN24381_c0_g1_i1.p1  ORF type:complete len:319 (+),score=60.27 TRINITY_DN24381_c0_g1_i1:40-957(+)
MAKAASRSNGASMPLSARGSREDASVEAAQQSDKEYLRKRFLDNLQRERREQQEARIPKALPLLNEFIRSPQKGNMSQRAVIKGPSGGPSAPGAWAEQRREEHRRKKERNDACDPRNWRRKKIETKEAAQQHSSGSHSAEMKEIPAAAKKSGEIDEDYAKSESVDGKAALFSVYKAIVTRRQDESEEKGESCFGPQQFFDSIDSQVCNASLGAGSSHNVSAMSTDTVRMSKNGCRGLPPGLVAWQSPQNPWRWPRNGALPPMEASVLALLNGQPPPTRVSAEEAAWARQVFAMIPPPQAPSPCMW